MKYLHKVKKHKPMTSYKARCMFDIEKVLGDKNNVHCCQLNSGEWLAFFSRLKKNEQTQGL